MNKHDGSTIESLFEELDELKEIDNRAAENIMNIEILSKPWQKFFFRFAEIETLELNEWKDIHFLAYFCKRYKDIFGRDYAFSFKGPPSKCFEIIMIRKIYSSLGTADPQIVKEYIDWIFDYKIIPKKYQLKSISFLLCSGFPNEFFFCREKKTKIDKSSSLPANYLQLVSKFEIDVQTYGDLNFLVQALQANPDVEPYKTFYNQLCSLGFSPTVLLGLS